MITLITNIFAVLLTLLPLDIQKSTPEQLWDIISETEDTCCTQVMLPSAYDRDMSLDININEEKLFITAIFSLLILLFVLVINALIKNSLNRTMAFDLAKYLRQDWNNDRKVMSTIQEDIQKVTDEIKDMRMSLYNLKNDIIEDKRVGIPDFESDEDMEKIQPKKSDNITDRRVKKTEEPEFNVNYRLMKAEDQSEAWNEKVSEMWKSELTEDYRYLKLKFNFYGTDIIYFDYNPYSKELCNTFTSLFKIDWNIRDKETCPIEYVKLHELLCTEERITWNMFTGKSGCCNIENNLGMDIYTYNMLPIVNARDRQTMTWLIKEYLQKLEYLYQKYSDFEEGSMCETTPCITHDSEDFSSEMFKDEGII